MTEKQTVLITGGCGFIGTNFVRLLMGTGDLQVVNLDALTYAANPLSLKDLEENPDYVFVKGGITDRELVASLFSQYQPVGVFHFAAESHVDRSIVHAEDFVLTNVLGTFTLLEVARDYWNELPDDKKKTFRFLHVSTDEVFGSLGPDGRVRETQVDAFSFAQPKRTILGSIIADCDYQVEIHVAKLVCRFRIAIMCDTNFIEYLNCFRVHISGRFSPGRERPPIIRKAGIDNRFGHL